MPKNVQILARAVAGLALIAFFTCHSAAFAQSVVTGDWTASVDSDKPDKINLTFERRGDRGGKSQMGSTYDFAELQGLSRGQAAAGGPVKFSLVREAGRIDCEGSFQDGKGSGTFRFTGDQGFVAAMKGRGFDFEHKSSAAGGRRDIEDRLFAAAALNVTTALADDLLAAGFGRLNADDLFKAAIFKVDAKFAREMKASGFADLGLEELVKARIFKVDADFAGQVSRMGFAEVPFETLVKMRIFKVTPEFVAEVRNEGLTSPSVEDLVQMRVFKIDAGFIREAKAEGVPVEVEQLVQRRIGVRRRGR